MRRIPHRTATRSNRGSLYARSPPTPVNIFAQEIYSKKYSRNISRRFAARQFTVRLGDIDLERDDEPSAPATYTVNQIHAHPKFSRVGFYNDIAVLELARPVRKSPYVIPICLPQLRYRSERFAGARPTVVGWGTTYYGKSTANLYLYLSPLKLSPRYI